MIPGGRKQEAMLCLTRTEGNCPHFSKEGVFLHRFEWLDFSSECLCDAGNFKVDRKELRKGMNERKHWSAFPTFLPTTLSHCINLGQGRQSAPFWSLGITQHLSALVGSPTSPNGSFVLENMNGSV